MKKTLLTLLATMLGVQAMNAQVPVYKDSYSNDVGAPSASYWGTPGAGLSVSHTAASGTVVITGNGSSANYNSISYTPYDNPEMSGSGDAIEAVDMTGTNDTIFVVAKSSVAGAKLRIDLKDASDFVANAGGITSEFALTLNYAIYKFVYKTPQDGAYGGTGCATGPCTVDKETIKEFLFYVEAADGEFEGTVTIDYFQVGGSSATVTTSNVSSTSLISDAVVYPNPATDKATVNLSLKSNSDIKVILSNVYGTQLEVLEANGNSFNGTFNTSALSAGVYTLSYYINGESAGAQLLVK